MPEYEALLLCHAAHPWLAPDCAPPAATCDVELEAVKACVYPAGPCEIGQCSAGAGVGAPSMKCEFACGDVVYTSACGKVGSTSGYPMDCECQIDGEPVGACQSVTPQGAFTLGCCSEYFAESE